VQRRIYLLVDLISSMILLYLKFLSLALFVLQCRFGAEQGPKEIAVKLVCSFSIIKNISGRAIALSVKVKPLLYFLDNDVILCLL